MQPVRPLEELVKSVRRLKVGESLDIESLIKWLHANGYKRSDAVEYPGEYGRRGGICDIFPPDATDPVRIEFFGDLPGIKVECRLRFRAFLCSLLMASYFE